MRWRRRPPTTSRADKSEPEVLATATLCLPTKNMATIPFVSSGLDAEGRPGKWETRQVRNERARVNLRPHSFVRFVFSCVDHSHLARWCYAGVVVRPSPLASKCESEVLASTLPPPSHANVSRRWLLPSRAVAARPSFQRRMRACPLSFVRQRGGSGNAGIVR